MVPAMPEDGPDPESPPPAEPSESSGRRPRVAILLTFAGVFLLLLFLFRDVLFPFLMAIYVAYLVEPIVSRATRSRLLGIKWTRGPTLVVIYVVVLGGLAVLGWIGIAKLAKTVRTASSDVAAALKEDGHRARFDLLPPPGGASGEGAGTLGRDLVVPRGSAVVLRDVEYRTLYDVRIEAGETRATVLLEYAQDEDASQDLIKDFEEAEMRDVSRLRYGDGSEVEMAVASRIRVTAGGTATGLEYFAERRLIGPIVSNFATAGFEIEPRLVRDFIRIKAETLREDLPTRVGKGAVTVAGKLVLSVYTFLLILMLTAFIVMDRKGIARFFASLPPARHQTAYHSLIRYVDDGLAGVIRGQLVICGVNGLLTYVGLLFLGVPYAVLLASVAAVLSLIPVFGTIVSSIPIVLIATTKGLDTGILALAWIVLIHLLEANLLNPIIMGTHARMHPVIIIFALLAGEHAYGVWGALLAVPTMSLVQSSFRFYLHEVEGLPREEERPHGEWLRRLWRRLKARFGGGDEAPAEGADA
jgi:predicted PurR-regulated permease PerM